VTTARSAIDTLGFWAAVIFVVLIAGPVLLIVYAFDTRAQREEREAAAREFTESMRAGSAERSITSQTDYTSGAP